MIYFICRSAFVLSILLSSHDLFAQVNDQRGSNYQQHVNYSMQIDFNAAENKFNGYQKAIYSNNSPDTLQNIFYHLFYNAFQPGSAMAERAMNIKDQEGAIVRKMMSLKPDEYGYQLIDSLKINGKQQRFNIAGTIMKIFLDKSIAPQTETVIELWFKSQVPKMIIRTGRDNSEQVAFTMTQWYPKIAAYDRSGWHTEEYIRREFFGPFSDFDVSIKIDKRYCLAATGVLQNAEEIGYGYETKKLINNPGNGKYLTWHFKANKVHDFAWAADTSYRHTQRQTNNGMQLHFFYKPSTATIEDWNDLPGQVEDIFKWMEKKVGPYPYPQYSLVQGGSGGTEYPMLTMILGKRPVSKGISKGYPIITLAIHEIMHNWWYAVVANDENRNAWLDEGFALFFQYEYTDAISNKKDSDRSIKASYDYMLPPSRKGVVEPMTTPADFFDANWGYTIAAYHKGAIFLDQLRYITGEESFWKGMRAYYKKWSFAHPDGDDFILCMEQTSGMQLKWYLDLWTKTTRNIDYALGTIERKDHETIIPLLQKGLMPMPVDVLIELKDGSKLNYTIPQASMYGEKNEKDLKVAKPWSWTNPQYNLTIPVEYDRIKKIEIDPNKCLFDLNRANNSIDLSETKTLVY
ncbi:MAG TPA: M1 family metallopeptidase [Chitinophagaceae bacterium]|nr:M1 family metallopeptidase [Chitinophagaceae bacterium]